MIRLACNCSSWLFTLCLLTCLSVCLCCCWSSCCQCLLFFTPWFLLVDDAVVAATATATTTTTTSASLLITLGLCQLLSFDLTSFYLSLSLSLSLSLFLIWWSKSQIQANDLFDFVYFLLDLFRSFVCCCSVVVCSGWLSFGYHHWKMAGKCESVWVSMHTWLHSDQAYQQKCWPRLMSVGMSVEMYKVLRSTNTAQPITTLRSHLFWFYFKTIVS